MTTSNFQISAENHSQRRKYRNRESWICSPLIEKVLSSSFHTLWHKRIYAGVTMNTLALNSISWKTAYCARNRSETDFTSLLSPRHITIPKHQTEITQTDVCCVRDGRAEDRHDTWCWWCAVLRRSEAGLGKGLEEGPAGAWVSVKVSYLSLSIKLYENL